MGGGGSYYDRDTTPRKEVNDGYGYSSRADKAFTRSKTNRKVDKILNPRNRVLACDANDLLVLALDVTRSVGKLPKVLYDKIPMMAGELVERGYLGIDPRVSLAAVGDVYSDKAPIQVGNFVAVRDLDKWLKAMWLEYRGGGTGKESYEFAAYMYSERCVLGEMRNRYFIMTGDEDYYDELPKGKLYQYFGESRDSVSTLEVFNNLKRKFNGNVFMIHRPHKGSNDARIMSRWQNLLGKNRVIVLPEDMAIADIILGILAVQSGSRTLDGYCKDMKNRGQTDTRVIAVKKALFVLGSESSPKNSGEDMPAPAKTDKKKKSWEL